MPGKQTERIYEDAGFNTQLGYGTTPMVLVVDLQKGFTDPAHSLGGDLSDVIDQTTTLCNQAQTSNIPLVFTRIVSRHPNGDDLGMWGEKAPELTTLRPDSEWVELDDRLPRDPQDYLLDKKQASAFHETELNSLLTSWGVDTVIVTGCTTSGCIRASVIDACSHGYRPIVPEECVGDRAADPHQANLFDMDAKYADVCATADVMNYLTQEASPSA